MENNTTTKIVAIIGLTILGVVALYYGIDHFLIATISAIIGGIAGYEYGKNNEK